MLTLSHITSSAATTAESFFKTFVTIAFSKGRFLSAMLQHCERVSRNSHFQFPVSFSLLISVPPNRQNIRRKLVRILIRCHFIIFGERSDPPRIYESQGMGREREWSNGMEFSGYSDFPEF